MGLGGIRSSSQLDITAGGHIRQMQGWKAHTIGNNGYLELSNLGQVQLRGKAKTWGTPTTCTIVYRNGLWDASITVNCEPEPRKLGTGTIGIDLGTKTAAAIWDGSKGSFIDNPRWFQQSLPKIKKASRDQRRKRAPNRQKRIKASRRYKTAQNQVTKLYRQASFQRLNWIHHQAAHITSCNSMVATEKLEVKNMTRKAKKGVRFVRSKSVEILRYDRHLRGNPIRIEFALESLVNDNLMFI